MTTPSLNLTLTGSLHPHLLLIPLSPPPPPPPPSTLENCALHISLALPDALFPDPDELRDAWGADTELPLDEWSQVWYNLDATSLSGSRTTAGPGTSGSLGPIWWTLHPSIVDLERPLLLATQNQKEAQVVLDVALRAGQSLDLPLHARYLPPSASPVGLAESWGWGWGRVLEALGGEKYAHVPIFSSSIESKKGEAEAEAEGEGEKGERGGRGRLSAAWVCPPTSYAKFDRAALLPVPVHAHVVARIPVADTAYRLPVEIVTAAVVWAGWAWVVLKIACVTRRAAKSKIE